MYAYIFNLWNCNVDDKQYWIGFIKTNTIGVWYDCTTNASIYACTCTCTYTCTYAHAYAHAYAYINYLMSVKSAFWHDSVLLGWLVL